MKSLDPQITTIITTFHRPQFLKRAVESVLAQNYPYFHLCIYDNGSDEETYQLGKEFSKLDSRVFYHRHSNNIGMMNNYSYAFSRIDTPYFSFLSDDDFLLPDFYDTALTDLEQNPTAAFTVCNVYVINAEGERMFESLCLWEKTGLYDIPRGFLSMCTPSFKPPIPTCTLFRHDLVKRIVFDWSEDLQILWDPCFLLKLSSRFPFMINKTFCGYYLSHQGGFSSGLHERMNHSSQEMRIYLKAARHLIESVLIDNLDLSSEVKNKTQAALLQFFYHHIGTQILKCWKKGKVKEAILALWYRHKLLKMEEIR